MGGHLSKKTARVSSYEDACKLDSDLRTFNKNIQARTNRVINSLLVEVEVRTLSFHSLKEVTGCLFEMNQEVVKVILECKEDIWKDGELFKLVEEYLKTSLQTIDFCTALDKCLKGARDSQRLVDVALQRFENGSEVGESSKYERTLEQLKKFKDAGNPFSKEFFRNLQTVCKQHVSMLKKVQLRRNKLDKKLKYIKSGRKVSSIIVHATFAAVLICSVVAAAVGPPPVAAAFGAVAALPILSVGRWIDSLWSNIETILKGQKDVISSMQAGTRVAIKDLDNIRVSIDSLEIPIESMLKSAEFSIEGDAVKVGIVEIRKQVGVFMKNIEDLGIQADLCSRDIRRARTVVLQRIIKEPNN